MKSNMFTAITLSFGMTALPAKAEEISQIAIQKLGKVADQCIGNWDSKDCHQAIISSNLEMLASYQSSLNERNLPEFSKILIQVCDDAVSNKNTGNTEKLGISFLRCAGGIAQSYQYTGLKPDITLFQLMMLSGSCLLSNKKPCSKLDQVLQNYRSI